VLGSPPAVVSLVTFYYLLHRSGPPQPSPRYGTLPTAIISCASSSCTGSSRLALCSRLNSTWVQGGAAGAQPFGFRSDANTRY
jgi:hypothetical protein